MTQTIAPNFPITTVLASQWQQVGRKLAALAEAFPDDLFDRSPLAGVRTVGGVLRHVAYWNQYTADSLRGRNNDGAANELPPASYATRSQILDALNRTAADAAAALQALSLPPSPETVDLVLGFLEHTSEHYGQLVVYARLQGIVPPASRTDA